MPSPPPKIQFRIVPSNRSFYPVFVAQMPDKVPIWERAKNEISFCRIRKQKNRIYWNNTLGYKK